MYGNNWLVLYPPTAVNIALTFSLYIVNNSLVLESGVTILPFSKDYNSPIELSLVHKRKDIDFTVHAFAAITSEGIRVLKGSTIAPINDLIHSLLTNDNKKKRLECKVENNILCQVMA